MAIYWPDFLKFNSMRFLVLLMVFALLPFPGFRTGQVCTISLPPNCATGDKIAFSMTPETTSNMFMIIFEKLGGQGNHPGWVFLVSAILILVKLALSYFVTSLLFYYDRHSLSEDSAGKKVKFKF